ncbi:MAG: trypsin-like peptidase domain-containing protein [Polyangiaceae bacterium]|nr:trypsin-like peptidase domain-containing protein [Polyangiaceae bacterium]
MIATAHHVIRQVDDGLDHRIAVKLLDTSKFEQVLCLAEDKENDLAVIKIAKQGTEYLRLSSTDSIPQTTRIFVIGHPGKGTYSEFWSVTQGSVTSRAIGPDEKSITASMHASSLVTVAVQCCLPEARLSEWQTGR